MITSFILCNKELTVTARDGRITLYSRNPIRMRGMILYSYGEEGDLSFLTQQELDKARETAFYRLKYSLHTLTRNK